MEKRRAAQPRVILARSTFVDTSLNIFPQYGIYTGGHCCICIQSRCMHISPVSKLTSPFLPLPPRDHHVYRVSISQTNSSDYYFFFSFNYLINSRNILPSYQFSIHRKYSIKYYWVDGRNYIDFWFPFNYLIQFHQNWYSLSFQQ